MKNPGGRTKYNARRTPCSAGHIHASAAEQRRCDELRLLQRAGEITHLEQQPSFPISINGKHICTYKADFRYFLKDGGGSVCEDVKGIALPMYRLKKKLVEASYPGVKIVEVRG